MRLKYYMRGMGVGIILTALILSIANPKEKLSDDEIKSRAAALGMTMREENDSDISKLLNDIKPGNTSLSLTPEPEISPVISPGPSTTPTAQEPDKNGSSTADNSHSIDNSDSINNSAIIDNATTVENADSADSTTTVENTNSTDNTVTVESNNSIDSTAPYENTGMTDSATPVGNNSANGSISAALDDNSVSDRELSPAPTEAVTEASAQNDGITFTIQRGMSSGKVAALLKEKGLIEDADDFNMYIIRQGKASTIKIGTYTLPKGVSYKEIVSIISK